MDALCSVLYGPSVLIRQERTGGHDHVHVREVRVRPFGDHGRNVVGVRRA